MLEPAVNSVHAEDASVVEHHCGGPVVFPCRGVGGYRLLRSVLVAMKRGRSGADGGKGVYVATARKRNLISKTQMEAEASAFLGVSRRFSSGRGYLRNLQRVREQRGDL